MSMTTERNRVLSAEKEVTETLTQHGENSDEYKKALKNFATSWLSLTKREDQVNNVLKD